MIRFKLFGTEARTRVLAAVALLGETYPREIARVTALPLFSVQRIVIEFELEGVLATRLVGRTRRVTLDPRLYGVDDLNSFLIKYAKRDGALEAKIATMRRRPRRTGKAL